MRPRLFLLSFCALLLILFVGNAATPLWDQDEAAYAGISRNMMESGDWLEQSFIWAEIHRKPPLHFWAITSSFSIFGPNEFALRLPVVVAFLSVFTLLWWGFERIWPEWGYLAAMILAASFFAPVLGKIALTDGWLLLWECLAFLSLWHIMQPTVPPKWIIWFWLAIAMGVLTKGPAILLTVGMTCLMVLIVSPERKRIWRLQLWWAFPLALLPLLWWGYAAWQRDDGAMISWMIDWYILQRTGGSVLGQSGPPGYYLGTLLIAFLPFLQQLVPALVSWWQGVRARKTEDILLLCWLVGSWGIWELIPSKLPAYAIGAHPIIALLIAREYIRPNAKIIWQKIGLGLQIGLSLVLTAGLTGGSYYLWAWEGIWIPIALSLLLIGGTLWAPNRISSPVSARNIKIASAALFMLLVWILLMPRVNELRSGPKDIQVYLTENASPLSTIVLSNVSARPPSLPFYLGRNFNSLLENGDLATLQSLYNSKKPIVLLLSAAQYRDLKIFEPTVAEARIFPLFSSDRLKGNAYYVLLNDAAKIASHK